MNTNSKLRCEECDKEFARKFTLKRHMASKHHQNDGQESSVEDSQSVHEEDSNVSDTASANESEMESDVNVWKYYADVAWKMLSKRQSQYFRTLKISMI